MSADPSFVEGTSRPTPVPITTHQPGVVSASHGTLTSYTILQECPTPVPLQVWQAELLIGFALLLVYSLAFAVCSFVSWRAWMRGEGPYGDRVDVLE